MQVVVFINNYGAIIFSKEDTWFILFCWYTATCNFLHADREIACRLHLSCMYVVRSLYGLGSGSVP